MTLHRKEMGAKMNSRRITVTVGAAAGGLLAAAFLPMTVAAADDYFYWPDPLTFQEGSNPISLSPLFDLTTGTDNLNETDIATGGIIPDAEYGTVVTTNFLGVTETQFDEAGWIPSDPGALDIGSQISLLQLPGDWGSELILSSSVPLGLEDILLTPFGDFPI
jgi:hypothetical protein